MDFRSLLSKKGNISPSFSLPNRGIMENYILLDWSILCHTSWHRMGAKNYTPKYKTELQEFTYNLGKQLLYLYTKYQDHNFIIALDSDIGYWRHDYYKKWYNDFGMKVYTVPDPRYPDKNINIYYLEYDNNVHELKYWSDGKQWTENQLTKKDIELLDWSNANLLELDKVPRYIQKFYPEYKGNRKNNDWGYATSYESAKELWRKLAFNLPFANAIMYDKAEADDIAFALVDLYPVDNITLVTYDEDWHQLAMKSIFTKYVDPRTMEEIKVNAKQAQTVLITKIMCGDSDNIPKIQWKPGSKKIGEKKIPVFLMNNGLKGSLNYLKENGEEQSVKRNMKLVYLGNAPKELTEGIKNKLKELKPKQDVKIDWNTWLIPQKERAVIRLNAIAR